MRISEKKMRTLRLDIFPKISQIYLQLAGNNPPTEERKLQKQLDDLFLKFGRSVTQEEAHRWVGYWRTC